MDAVPDQAAKAFQLYAGGLSQQAYMSGHYGRTLLENVSGNWVSLGGPDDQSGAETYGATITKSCTSPAAVTLASLNDMTLTLTTNLAGPNLTQQYTLIAGSTFGEHTDPTAYLAAVGLGPDKTGDAADQQRALLLSAANGVVNLYRPSDDILVIIHDRSYPTVLGRCPAAAAK